VPYENPFLAAFRDRLEAAGEDRIEFDEAAWEPRIRSAVGVDVESYYNFFAICFKRFADGKRLAFELSDRSKLDAAAVRRVLEEYVTVSFNGLTYDLPLICLALEGADTVKLKEVTHRIITDNDVKPWDVEKLIGVRVPRFNHVDLMEPNPSVRQGLKVLAGRLHCRHLIDLPYAHDRMLTHREMNVTTLYCQYGDLDATERLYRALREPLELRAALGPTVGVDLRSRSDAQIGETIVRKRAERALNRRVTRAPYGETKFRYEVPELVRFEDEVLRNVLEKLRETDFYVTAAGKISTPSLLADLRVEIGRMTYSMGIGGLHSTEANRAVVADDERSLIDVDVASQYPNIILKLGIYPPALGPTFLTVYGDLIRERLAAKDAGETVTAEGLKIAVNGVFGKLGSPYSVLYAPNLLIATTLTGQLVILMLIERAEAAGIPVVSANTDGVVFHPRRRDEARLAEILAEWESETGFKTDRTPYRALYSSSVNSYVAIAESGKVKRKGPISDPWSDDKPRDQMQKNPQMTVCSEALVRYLTDGAPFEETIRACRDPRMFVTVIRVTGGAVWRNHSLGRVIRYYWSLDGDQILYEGSRKRVAKADGARPLLELTDEVPRDVDHLRYREETSRLAADYGIREL